MPTTAPAKEENGIIASAMYPSYSTVFQHIMKETLILQLMII
jgi:hypothetical protein